MVAVDVDEAVKIEPFPESVRIMSEGGEDSGEERTEGWGDWERGAGVIEVEGEPERRLGDFDEPGLVRADEE